MIPVFGKNDNMVSYITKIFLYSKDKSSQWKLNGEYQIKPEATYVYDWLHDGLTQFVIDLPNANNDLTKKLKEIMGFSSRYLWAPLGSRPIPYLLEMKSSSSEKLQLKGLDGKPAKYKSLELEGGSDEEEDAPRGRGEPVG